MARADYFLVVGDRLPVIQETLLDGAGVPVDLTGATVTLKIWPADDSTPPVLRPVTVLGPPTAGNVEYDWDPADSAAAGTLFARWRADFGAGLVASFPDDEHPLVILVSPR